MNASLWRAEHRRVRHRRTEEAHPARPAGRQDPVRLRPVRTGRRRRPGQRQDARRAQGRQGHHQRRQALDLGRRHVDYIYTLVRSGPPEAQTRKPVLPADPDPCQGRDAHQAGRHGRQRHGAARRDLRQCRDPGREHHGRRSRLEQGWNILAGPSLEMEKLGPCMPSGSAPPKRRWPRPGPTASSACRAASTSAAIRPCATCCPMRRPRCRPAA
jgi:hypothetical protein